MTAPLTAPLTEQDLEAALIDLAAVDFNDGLDAALTAVRERLRHWQDKRDLINAPAGMVEDELRVIEKMLHARRRG